jgi:hypothetical protein
MRDIEFYLLMLDKWPEFLLLNGLSFLLLFLIFRKILVGGILDPFFLIFIVGFSTNYAVVLFLYLNAYISFKLFTMVIVYAFVFILLFISFSKRIRLTTLLSRATAYIGARSSGRYEFKVALMFYFLLSLYLLSKIGFGLFAETNRFENNRGFGAFVRILDLFSVFIVSYATLIIARLPQSYKKWLLVSLLGVFIVYAAVINGAKISIIFSLLTVFLVLRIEGYKIKIARIKVVAVALIGISFVLVALKINLVKNNVDTGGKSEYIGSVSVVTERLIHRLVANGNTSYLLLPNGTIDKIEKDSVFVRFLVPIIGTTRMSRLLGYNVGNYSVGRQALLWYSPGTEVAGGPTSHFDFFSYVYFGYWGGAAFVGFLALMLGIINNEMHSYASKMRGSNIFIASLLATIWVRAIIVIVAPTIGLAYLFDICVVFFLLISLLSLLRRVSYGRT